VNRKLWVAVIILGVLMIPIGAVWVAYAIAQTDSTTRGGSGSESVWPIVAFFVAFLGGTLITVGIVGFMFRWLSGDEDDELGTSPSETLAHAVPKTRVGWGGDPAGGPPVTPPGGG
jgi:Kef-type K+ transport system membrane component KefB